MTDSGACIVCTEKYKVANPRIACPECKYASCRGCMEKWIETKKMAQCMNEKCQKNLPIGFLQIYCEPKFFDKKLKDLVKEKWYQEQYLLLPQTQREMQISKKIEVLNKLVRISQSVIRKEKKKIRVGKMNVSEQEIVEQKIKKEKNHIQLYNTQILTLSDEEAIDLETLPDLSDPAILEKYEIMLGDIKKIEDKKNTNTNLSIVDRTEYVKIKSLMDQLGKIAPNIEENYVIGCPEEKCPGFLSTQGICVICGQNVCMQCEGVIDVDEKSEHVCDEKQIESVEKIRQDSQSCPKCHVRINKNGGCSHMYCPRCKTHFDWITRKVQITNSNPLGKSVNRWSDQMRKSDALIISCPEVLYTQPTIYKIVIAIQYIYMEKMRNMFEIEIHEAIVLKSLRKKYLNREIELEEFKETIYQEKIGTEHNVLYQRLRILVKKTADKIRKFKSSNPVSIDNLIKELDKLRCEFNQECLRYTPKNKESIVLDEDWELNEDAIDMKIKEIEETFEEEICTQLTTKNIRCTMKATRNNLCTRHYNILTKNP